MTTIIIRHHWAKHFTTLPNSCLRDSRLSFRARGVLVHLLSLPDRTSSSAEKLATEGREGRGAVRRAMAELIEAGYVRRSREQRSDGTWVTITEVSDEPKTENRSPVSQPPKTENRSPVNRSPVDRSLRDKEPVESNNGNGRFRRVASVDEGGRLWVQDEGS